MHSYFYHLKFELYPTPNPDSEPETKEELQTWLPRNDINIFDRLPSHPRQQPRPAPQRSSRQYHQQQRSSPSGPQAELEGGLIDCGAPRRAETPDNRNIVRVGAGYRALSFPPPVPSAAIKPQTAVKDWRFGSLRIESIDTDHHESQRLNMAGGAGSASSAMTPAAAPVGPPSMGTAGKATKAKYVPLTTNTAMGWGIVHLYREGDETSFPAPPSTMETTLDQSDDSDEDSDYTTLCIPAVPSYLSPSDFLGFIGEKWRDQISHYRMVMTGRLNRYLVLIKFRDGKGALLFRREFDGKVFNEIEPETCHVVHIRSITFDTPTRADGNFPDLSQDPFTPSTTSSSSSLKPFPPPTPSLIELPTCPVCLERMDDTTGLLTIPCQHVFHCSCLQKWKGSGCPVCRHTNPSNHTTGSRSDYGGFPSSSSGSHSVGSYDPSNPYTQPFGSHVSNLCAVCDSPDDLWICLICGNVGCGRYKGGHAKDHWKETAHTFSLELDTQHVWDYAGDIWVHRLIRDKGDEKVIELPGHNEGFHGHSHAEPQDVVPRAKLDSIGMEYTHLLTSQLESQRVYFEEMVSKAVDKAARASAAADKATYQASEALAELRALKEDHRQLKKDTIPNLEKDLAREQTRANKSTELARSMGKSLQEEKQVSEGLLKRIEHVNKELGALSGKVKELQIENADLKDQNHDLSMFISGQEKLKELEAEGQMEEGEIQEGTAAVPEERRRRKGKGKAK